MCETLFYIGSDKQYVKHFKSLVSEDLPVFENPFEVIRLSREAVVGGGDAALPDDKGLHVVIFFEKGNLQSDLAKVKFLKQSIPFAYIFLVAENLLPEDALEYLHAGINDTMHADISPEVFAEAIGFTAKNHQALVMCGEEEGKKQPDAVSFEMPTWKRLFDIVFSLAAIVALSPVFIFTAIAIRLESKGPVVYKSKRVGSNYKVFDFLKFRSMQTDADKHLNEMKDLNQYGGEKSEGLTDDQFLEQFGSLLLFDDESVPENIGGILIADDSTLVEDEYITQKTTDRNNTFVKVENDPRITKTGRFIRKYSIDELPQLFNILKGDMSVVGNRPLPLYEAELLTNDEFIDRFMAPSGLTGLWQVEKRGGAGKLSPEERKQLDIEYAKSFSLWLDIKIIFKTFTAFVQKENV